MREFEIRLSSVKDVQDFVALATTRPFAVYVHDDHRQVSGKNFMEMFCLTLHRPVIVTSDCTEAEMEAFRADAQRFAVQ